MQDTVTLKGTHKGLEVGRRYLGHYHEKNTRQVHVYYEQYLVTPSGDEIEHERRSYILMDQPTTYRQKNSVKTPAEYSKNGKIEKEAELYDGTEELAEGHTNYSDWVLENESIQKEAMGVLLELPASVSNAYQLGNPNN